MPRINPFIGLEESSREETGERDQPERTLDTDEITAILLGAGAGQ